MRRRADDKLSGTYIFKQIITTNFLDEKMFVDIGILRVKAPNYLNSVCICECLMTSQR